MPAHQKVPSSVDPTDRLVAGRSGALRARLALQGGLGLFAARAVCVALTLILLAVAALFFVAQAVSPHMPGFAGMDLRLYLDATRRWLGGGPYFLPEQVTGEPYTITFGAVLYPPVAFLLFVPALVLPTVLWWVIPIGVTVGIVIYLRPAIWTWPIMALCLAYYPTSQLIWAGNPAMWMMAALAVATRWRPMAAFLFLKPSVAPLALFGARDRRWWALIAGLVGVSLLFLPLDLQWLTAIVNGQGDQSGLLYSLRDVPLLAIPLVAWAGRSSQARGQRPKTIARQG
jgi:hypothetical protein